MNSLKSIAVCLSMLSILIIGCKNDIEVQGVAAYIPATSTSVTGISTKRLMDKADFEAIKQMEFYNRMVTEAANKNSLMAEVLLDPAKSGIDLEEKIYIANQVDNIDSIDVSFQVFIPLAAVSDLEKLLSESGFSFEMANDVKYIAPDNEFVMAWNNDVLNFTFCPNCADGILNRALNPFDEDNRGKSISHQNGFSKAMNSDHDIVSWFTSDALANDPAVSLTSTFLNIDKEDLKGNNIYAYANFEPGRIVGHADFDVKKQFGRNIIGSFFNEESKTDFSKVLPTEGLAFAVTTSLNYRGMDRFLSERPMTKDKADFVLNNISGLERKNILEVFNGDIMLASYSATNMKKEDLLIAMAFKSENKAEDFLTDAVKNKKLKEIEKGYYKLISIGGEDFTISVNKGLAKLLYKDGLLIYSPNESLLEKIKNEEIGDNGEAQKVVSSFKGNAVNAWADFSKITKNITGASEEFVEDIQFNANGDGANFILKLKNKNTNSLKLMFEAFNKDYITKNTEPM